MRGLSFTHTLNNWSSYVWCLLFHPNSYLQVLPSSCVVGELRIVSVAKTTTRPRVSANCPAHNYQFTHAQFAEGLHFSAFQVGVVLKQLVSLMGHLLACSARISANTHTHKPSTVTLAVHASRGKPRKSFTSRQFHCQWMKPPHPPSPFRRHMCLKNHALQMRLRRKQMQKRTNY